MFYLLFILNLGLILWRALRSRKWGERTVLAVLLLFLVLTLSMHPWIAKSSWSLAVLEKTVLWANLFWLAGGPFFFWLEKKRRERMFFQFFRNGRGPFSEIVSACRILSESRQGALVAIQRKDSLARWIVAAVPVGATIRKETIFSIFTPPGALHDGGMIIQGDRIAAAGAVFPLSQRQDLPRDLGTRHRAALGMSEVTDALAIVVSEETGKISFASRGTLLYDVKQDRLAGMIESALKNRRPRRPFQRLPSQASLSGFAQALR